MSNEWYTPSKYIEAVREVIHEIDLDPASCIEANETVKAKKFYTEKDNGLSSYWQGNVFVNAPFSGQAKWVKKAIAEHEKGNTEECILLLQAATERVWFQQLWKYSICFVNHQIIFNRPNDKPYHIYHGTCFVYMGDNQGLFHEVFSRFGPVVNINKE